jgi:capsular exopolysaccharide synthesis family protein
MEAAPDKAHPHPPQEGAVELRRYLHVLYERRWAVAACLLAGALGFAWWASHQSKIYQATTTIIVENAPPQVMGSDVRDVVQVGPGQYWEMQDYIQTQRRVLTSDRLAERVVDRLKLDRDSAFWGGGLPADARAAAQAFIDAVTADRIPDTQVIAISYRHRDPEQAKRAVDTLADVYIESNVVGRDVSTASASLWLSRETDELRKRLSEAEFALYDFKKKNELLSVSLEERINNVGRQVDKLTDALTEVRLRRVARAAEAEELGRIKSGNAESIAPVANSPALEALRGQVVDEERKLSELRARYEEPHPLVRQQLAKTQLVHAALAREIERLIGASRSRTNEARDEEKSIATQLAEAKDEGLRMTRLEIDYNKLKREADAISKQYLLVQNRQKEIELSSKIKANNLHVLDYARLPTIPVSPHLARSGVGAMLLAALLAILVALLLDALDSSVKTQEDVEHKLGLPLLGLMPPVAQAGDPRNGSGAGGGSRPVVIEDPSSPAAECCRVIRTNLLYAGLKQPLRRLLITSSLAREGKTLMSVNLGAVLAQGSSKVLLIDSDLRSPRLHKALGMRAGIGLTDVLLGNASLDEAIQPTGIPNLSVLLSGGVPPNPADVIEGAGFRQLLDACSERFDRVVLDSPPVLPVTDPALLATYCDGVLMVVRSGRTGVAQARRTRQAIGDLGARLLGVVLNDHSPRGFDYGYGYYGRYGAHVEREARKESQSASG